MWRTSTDHTPSLLSNIFASFLVSKFNMNMVLTETTLVVYSWTRRLSAILISAAHASLGCIRTWMMTLREHSSWFNRVQFLISFVVFLYNFYKKSLCVRKIFWDTNVQRKSQKLFDKELWSKYVLRSYYQNVYTLQQKLMWAGCDTLFNKKRR